MFHMICPCFASQYKQCIYIKKMCFFGLYELVKNKIHSNGHKQVITSFAFSFSMGLVVTVIPSLVSWSLSYYLLGVYTCSYGPLYSKLILLNSEGLQCGVC